MRPAGHFARYFLAFVALSAVPRTVIYGTAGGKRPEKQWQHTVRYTELSPARFKNLWRD
jgi:hypothetical protein